MSTKRQTRPPAGDNLEFIFPDEPHRDVAETDDEAHATDIDELDEVALPSAADHSPAAIVARPSADDVASETSPHADEEDAARAEPRIAAPEFEAFDASVAASDKEDEDDAAAAHDSDLIYDDIGDDDEASTADEWTHELEALDASEPAHAPRVLQVEDIMARSHGFTTIARSLLAIVALHALLAFSIRLAPTYARAWLARIPLAGALLAHEPPLTQRVELRNVAGTFQELRNARRVFVITGEAVNRSPASVERIEVEGTLYDGDGRIDRKIVSAGNRTRLRDLSEKEIALLQRLNPRRVVAPGESSTFLIVFLEPPRTVREFSSRVSSVRPTRHLAADPTGSHPDSPDSVG